MYIGNDRFSRRSPVYMQPVLGFAVRKSSSAGSARPGRAHLFAFLKPISESEWSASTTNAENRRYGW